MKKNWLTCLKTASVERQVYFQTVQREWTSPIIQKTVEECLRPGNTRAGNGNPPTRIQNWMQESMHDQPYHAIAAVEKLRADEERSGTARLNADVRGGTTHATVGTKSERQDKGGPAIH